MPIDLERHLDDLKRRDDKAFEIIYGSTRYSVYGAIRAIVEDPRAVEDLMQDTYMRMLDRLDGYRRGSNFNAWITQIAKNIAYDHLRRTKNELRFDPDARPDLLDPVVEADGNGIDFDGLLAALSEEERMIVMLRAVGGQSFRDIATAVGKSVGTVHAVYGRAIAGMSKQVREGR